MPEADRDDRLTIAAISITACVLQDVLHEGLGHGVTAWLTGARHITVSTVALQSDLDTHLIAANGTLVNLLFAGLFWLLLRRRHYHPATRYFLVLALAGNLFTGTGYFLFSGVTNFGDWADVIRGLDPHWLWQFLLVAGGIALYWGSMVLVAAALEPFREIRGRPSRTLRLCYIPYFADGLLAAAGGFMNPVGFFYVIASALPSTLGANAGLLSLPFLLPKWRRRERLEESVAHIRRSPGWIAAGAMASLFFILVLGRGITWSR